MAQLAGEIMGEARSSDDEPPTGPDAGSRRQAPWRGAGRRSLDGVLLASVVVAGVVRFWGIGAQSLWYDEWLTAEAASGSPMNLVRYVGGSAGIPPTYFTLMWGWARVVGDSDAALRAFSALVGVAMVPLVYALAAELRQRRAVARVAGVLVAVNPMLVWYSQEARPYTLVAFMGGLSLWALARVWNRGRRVDLVIWAFVGTLTVAVHYYAVFLVAVEALGLLWGRRQELPRLWESWRQDRRSWLRSLAPIGVVAVLLAPFAVKQFLNRGQHGWIEDQDFGTRLRGVGTGALVGPSPPSGRFWMALAAVVVLSVVFLLLRGRREDRRVAAVCAGLSLATVLLTVTAKVVGVDAVIERYLIVALVPLVLAVATGFGALFRPRREGLVRVLPGWVVGAGAVGATCLLSLGVVVTMARDPELHRTEWQAVAEAHDNSGRPSQSGRVLVINVQGYLGGPLQRYLDDPSRLGEDERVLVDQLDVPVLQEMTRPCNGLIGRSCNLYFLGSFPPVVVEHYEPAELAQLAGLELAELAALVSLAEVPFDELVELTERATGAPLDVEGLEARHPVDLAEEAGLGLAELVELVGGRQVPLDELEIRRPDELAELAQLEPPDLDEWVERVDLDQFAIDRYELDRPRYLTRDDFVRPRWDGEWHGLVLVSEPDR